MRPRFRSPPTVGFLGPGWPIFGILYGFIVLWVLGLSALVWPIAAVVMALHLWSRRHVYSPPGFGLWLLFLGWMVLSGINLTSASDALVFGYRAALYVSAAVILVYVYNLPRGVVPSSRLVSAIAFFWAVVILLGLLAGVMPGLRFRSLLEVLLPNGVSSIGFVRNLIHPTFAQVHDFLGFPIARPAAPFPFSNVWGSVVALLAPMFWLWTQSQTSRARRTVGIAVLVVSLIPIVQSLNRGLWLSLTVAIAYAGVRFAVQGRARPLLNIAAGVGLAAVLLLASPLGWLVTERAAEGHSDVRRASLVQKSVDATMASPIIGHGGPIPDVEDLEHITPAALEAGWTPPPIGTHGQLWLVLVSHGIPAALFFVAFLLYCLWFTRSPLNSPTVFWPHVTILVAVTQLPFYGLLSGQLPILAIVIAMAMRELRPPGGGGVSETSQSSAGSSAGRGML